MPQNRPPTEGVRSAARALRAQWRRRTTSHPAEAPIREIVEPPDVQDLIDRVTRRFNTAVEDMRLAQTQARAVDRTLFDNLFAASRDYNQSINTWLGAARRIDFRPEPGEPLTLDQLIEQINDLKNRGVIKVTRSGKVSFEHHTVMQNSDDGTEYDVGPLVCTFDFSTLYEDRILVVKPTREHANPRSTPYLRSHHGYFHPHVRPNGTTCMGALRGVLDSAIRTMSLNAIMQVTKTYLETYNPRSPFVPVADFDHFGPRRADHIVFLTNQQRMSFPRAVFMSIDRPGQNWNIMGGVRIDPFRWRELVHYEETNDDVQVPASTLPFLLQHGEWFVEPDEIQVFWERSNLIITCTIPNSAIHARDADSFERVRQRREQRSVINQATGSTSSPSEEEEMVPF